jgi:hypothetical protein
LKLIGINSAYEGDQRACNGNALAANVEYNRKFIEQTQASEQLPKLEDIAELRLEQGFGGMWSYSAARSIFSRSGATHEIYFADTQALACELPKDLRSLNDERKFISTFAKNGSPYMTTVDLHSKIEQSVWNGNVLQLKYVEKNRQYALGHLEESVLTRLYFLPQGPRFTRLPIVKCD